MAYFTLPIEGSTGTYFLDWQQESWALSPDRISSGLTVSLVSSTKVRMAAGLAAVGGCVFQNTANADFTVAAVVGGGSRIDRLVLRLTVASAGASVDIQPAVKSSAVATTPTLPGLTTTLGEGVYEIAVARWTVTSAGVTSSSLMSEAFRYAPTPQTALFDMDRSSVPADSTVGGITDSISQVTGYTLEWNAGGSTALAPFTTTAPAPALTRTELVIGASGWYRIDGVIQLSAFGASGSTYEVVAGLSFDDGVTWQVIAANQISSGRLSLSLNSYPRLMTPGDRLRVLVHRTTAGPGTIGGRVTLTALSYLPG